MRKFLLSLTVLAGTAGAASLAQAAPHAEPRFAPMVHTVQYNGPDWRQREWRRHAEHERWRRHQEWRRWHHARGGW